MSERLALETIAHCCLSSIIPSQHSYSMTMIHHYSITHSNIHNFHAHLHCDVDHIARASPKQVLRCCLWALKELTLGQSSRGFSVHSAIQFLFESHYVPSLVPRLSNNIIVRGRKREPGIYCNACAYGVVLVSKIKSDMHNKMLCKSICKLC